jgi:HK97 family phage portal protein
MGLFGGRSGPGGAERPQEEQRALFGIGSANDLIPPRPYLRPNMPVVTSETARRHSAVWAALRLRADMISTLPLGVYRQVAGINVGWPTPQVLTMPGGERVDIHEWLYSSQQDLDSAGNAIGLITAADGMGFPARIELQPIGACSLVVKDGQLYRYRIAGKLYNPDEVWHEKQHTMSGLHFGLSPVAYAAWSIGEYLSVQQFAIDWFSGGAVPRARLKNAAKQLDPSEAIKVKEAWRASIAAGEPFVSGNDWEYDFIQAQSASADWIEAKQFSITDIARFFGVPADLIDAAPTGSHTNVRYANITQAHLQFLVIHLQAPLIRREVALSRLLPAPRFVKFDANSLLRMDPNTFATLIQSKIAARVLAPSEARAMEDRPPFTDAQLAEFDRLFGPPKTGEGGPASPALPPGLGNGPGPSELPGSGDPLALPPGGSS